MCLCVCVCAVRGTVFMNENITRTRERARAYCVERYEQMAFRAAVTSCECGTGCVFTRLRFGAVALLLGKRSARSTCGESATSSSHGYVRGGSACPKRFQMKLLFHTQHTQTLQVPILVPLCVRSRSDLNYDGYGLMRGTPR